MSESDKSPILEAAKSSRSACRLCHQKIMKGEYRIGIPYDFTTSDGNIVTSYRYHHPKCVPVRNIDLVTKLIKNNTTIESAIKELIFKELDEAKKAQKDRSSSPYIEESKSSRSTCRLCEEKIQKETYRVAEPEQVELEDGRSFSSHKYFHINCYLDHQKNPKEIFDKLTQVSINRNIFTRSEAALLEKKLDQILSSDKLSSDILSMISDKPIDLDQLKHRAQELGVSNETLMKSIERGLLQGIYFEPSPGKIQKL
ncbi:MAG: hypothetical protein EAX86_03875 [Candidatus Heimdallarchaeota archaeon]|nr:hypothetical protein [Candidatus Heimdallarchaeota archaeon]